MSNNCDLVKFIPILGGRQEGGVCSIVEIGDARILLDCGYLSDKLSKNLDHVKGILKSCGKIDAILISHADILHMGALPMIFGQEGISGVPIICTLPIYRMGQMILYDLIINQEMEGIGNSECNLDDIDHCFMNTIIVKYRQEITVPNSNGISVCAHPSGRTIGGSIWHIRYRATEVLYVMDINLRKEYVLDGAALDLPTSPSLLIVEGGCMESTQSSRRKKGRTEGIVDIVMSTVRADGNVLLPCESVGRTLELLQILGKHWADNNLAMYHLVFLTPMAHNIIEFSRSQLEWMSDTISSGFYNGKPNPFLLPKIHFMTTLKELDALPPGPRVVLTTDATLCCGFSKALLLRWGGDRKSCVIFTDDSEPGTLAAELRDQEPPVIASVQKTERVELVGEELRLFLENQEKEMNEREANEQKERRKDELAQLAAGQEDDQEDDDEEDIDSTMTNTAQSASVRNANGKRLRSTTSASGGDRETRKAKMGMDRFATPRHPMFENSDRKNLPVGEYGAGLDDLTMLMKSSAAQMATVPSGSAGGETIKGWQLQLQSKLSPSLPRSINSSTIASVGIVGNASFVSMPLKPSKLVAKRVRMQFTCGFRHVKLGGRADSKAIKTILTSVAAKRFVVIRGKGHECDSVVTNLKLLGADGWAPANGDAIQFESRGERLRIELSSTLMSSLGRMVIGESPSGVVTAVGAGGGGGSSSRVTCRIASLSGKVGETTASGVGGMRIVKLLEDDTKDTEPSSEPVQGGAGQIDLIIGSSGNANLAASLQAFRQLRQTTSMSISSQVKLQHGLKIGAISVGEVLLKDLRLAIERSAIPVEYRLGSTGGLLVCGGQVLLKKENENDFVLEGPPNVSFYKARQALYQPFVFV